MSSEMLSASLEDLSGLRKQIQIHDHPQMKEAPIAASGVETDGQTFDQMMKRQTPAQTVDTSRAHLPAPMQEAARIGGVLRVEEAKQLGAVLDRFKRSQEGRWKEMMNKLEGNSSTELSPTVSRHLEMKMDSIDKQFGKLRKDLGLPEVDPSTNIDFRQSLDITTKELSKPLETFFNFIARGERQLYGLQADIDAAMGNPDQIVNPAVMLKLQLKMTHVSQQLELFTSMMNKGLESSKTVFNTQI